MSSRPSDSPGAARSDDSDRSRTSSVDGAGVAATRTAGVIAGNLPAPRTGVPPALAAHDVDLVVRAALAEDVGGGDLTSIGAVPASARARATLLCKSEGVAAGLAVFARAFTLSDPTARVELLHEDGRAYGRGDVLVRVEGAARALLTAERTALNFVQRMCGVATATARYVAAARASGMSPVRILDTRKTTPNLRILEKYAVRCGGGENHRFGLHDEVMVKENHIELAGRPLVDVLRTLRLAVGPRVRITSEARDEREALAGVEGGADVVLLDNLSPAEMTRLCPLLRRHALERGRTVELEASGGIDLTTIGAVARSGVDRISVGALTHSAPAMDLSLDLEPLP